MLVDHAKSMLWTAVGLSLFGTAIGITIRGADIAELAAKAAVTVYTQQTPNIYVQQFEESEGDADTGSQTVFQTYTGSQIIFIWRNSAKEDIQITVNGTALPAPGFNPEPEWELPISGISTEELFTATYTYNKNNEIKEISFTGK